MDLAIIADFATLAELLTNNKRVIRAITNDAPLVIPGCWTRWTYDGITYRSHNGAVFATKDNIVSYYDYEREQWRGLYKESEG